MRIYSRVEAVAKKKGALNRGASNGRDGRREGGERCKQTWLDGQRRDGAQEAGSFFYLTDILALHVEDENFAVCVVADVNNLFLFIN